MSEAEVQVRGNSRVPNAVARESDKINRIAGLEKNLGKIVDFYGRGKKYKTVYDKGKKWVDRLARFRKVLNEETRPAQVFEEGLNLVKYVLEKILKGATKHPYWKLHEAHFKILKQAIQATTSVEMAQQEQKKAISIAKEITERAKWANEEFNLKNGKGRAGELTAIYNQIIMASYARRMSAAHVQFQKDLGSLDYKIFGLYEEREDLVNEIFTEYAILELDQKLVEEYMRSYKEKLDKMREKGKDSLSIAFAAMREHSGELEEYLAMSKSSGGAYGDAVSAARGGVGGVYQLARNWARELDKQDARIEQMMAAD